MLLVARRLASSHLFRWDQIQGVKSRDLPDDQLQEFAQLDAVLYTTPVVNTPRKIERYIPKLRDLLKDFGQEQIRREETRTLKKIQKRGAKSDASCEQFRESQVSLQRVFVNEHVALSRSFTGHIQAPAAAGLAGADGAAARSGADAGSAASRQRRLAWCPTANKPCSAVKIYCSGSGIVLGSTNRLMRISRL